MSMKQLKIHKTGGIPGMKEIEVSHLINHLEFRMRRNLSNRELGILKNALLKKYQFNVLLDGVDMIRGNGFNTIYVLASLLKKIDQREKNKEYVQNKIGEVAFKLGVN